MSGISTATPGRTAPPRAGLAASGRPSGGRPLRRVRHQVRDGVAVMLFSALTSSALAVLLTVLVRLGS